MEPIYTYVPKLQRWQLRYALGAALAALALELNHLVFPLTDRSSIFLAETAVALAAFFAGLGPGLLACVISVAGFYAWLLPRWEGAPGELEVRMAIFTASSLLISVLGGSLRRALLDAHSQRRRAEAALRARDELIAAVAHEIKNPLTALRLQTQLAAKQLEKEDSAADRAALAKLVRAADGAFVRIHSFVQEMLDLALLAECRMSLHASRFDLRELLDAVAERHRAEADLLGVSIAVDCRRGIVGSWDRGRLDQVVTNLVSNALKYGGGTPVTISARTEGAEVEIAVRDGGRGIRPENLERIFGSFERGEATDAVEGTGLGLYISRKIVQLFSGRIWAESEPGKGARFVLRIPRG